MYLDIYNKSFTPRNHVIVNFHGKFVCFAWHEKNFICFPYVYNDTTDVLQVYQAPNVIKDVRSFNERIFILCEPSGIYKFLETCEFALLSKAGIEFGSAYYESLVVNKGQLVLKNKKDKDAKNLLSLSASDVDVHTLSLNCQCTDKSLRKAFLGDGYNDNVNSFVFSDQRKLFIVTDNTVQLVYYCDYAIKSIVPVKKFDKIVCIILQTNGETIVLIHVYEDKLRYECIPFQNKVERVCATMDLIRDNTVFIVHTDEQNTYYTKMTLENSCNLITKVEKKHYQCFIFHQSQFFIFLNDKNEIVQVPLDFLKSTFDTSDNGFMKLELIMLKGFENTIEKICTASKSLKQLTDEIMEKEDNLKRINLFVSKKHIRYCPKESVQRLSNQLFLVSDFDKILPTNTIVVKMLKSKKRKIFCMKNVDDNSNTILQMPICNNHLSSEIDTSTDLITYKNDGTIWCLIKNFIRDPIPNKTNQINLSLEKKNFIKHKLTVLKNLMKDNKLSMEDLIKIKHEVREELQDDF